MSQINNKDDARILMTEVVSKLLPDIIATKTSIISIGTVNAVNIGARTVDVALWTESRTVSSMKYSKGITPSIGDVAIIVSTQPNLKGQIFCIGIF